MRWYPVFNGTYWEIRDTPFKWTGQIIGDTCAGSFYVEDNEVKNDCQRAEGYARLMAAAPELRQQLTDIIMEYEHKDKIDSDTIIQAINLINSTHESNL